MTLDTGNILMVGSILLFISIIAGKAGYKFGVPMLLLFLGVGMFFGSDGLGIQFNSPSAAQFIGMIALSIILFSGGMDTKYSEIKPVAVPGIILATLGVMLTALLTGGLIYCISGILTGVPSLTFTESLLLASVMSSTDSASVFSILRSRGLRLKENLRPLLELESGSNDPMAYMLTILLIQIIQSGDMSFSQAALMLLQQFAVGAVAGYLLGRLALHVINRLNIDNEALYPILLVACVFFIFAFNLYSGVRSVDPALVAAVRLLGGSRWQVLGKVIWPACLPWLLASLRTGLGLALSGAIVGEYLGSTQGMGWLLSAAGDVYNAHRVLCCVLVLVVIIVLLDGVVRLLERRLLRWQRSP